MTKLFALIAVLFSLLVAGCASPAEAAQTVADTFVGQQQQADVKAATLDSALTARAQKCFSIASKSTGKAAIVVDESKEGTPTAFVWVAEFGQGNQECSQAMPWKYFAPFKSQLVRKAAQAGTLNVSYIPESGVASEVLFCHGIPIGSCDNYAKTYSNSSEVMADWVSVYVQYEGGAVGESYIWGSMCDATWLSEYGFETAHCVRDLQDAVRHARAFIAKYTAKPVSADAFGFVVAGFVCSLCGKGFWAKAASVAATMNIDKSTVVCDECESACKCWDAGVCAGCAYEFSGKA